jgi:hypothetical protein
MIYLGGPTRWRQLAEQCAVAISESFPNILILVPSVRTTFYGRGIEPWVIDDPIPVPNVVCTFHRYYYQDFLYRDQNPEYVTSYEVGNYEMARYELEIAWQQIVFRAMDAGRAHSIDKQEGPELVLCCLVAWCLRTH